MADNNNALLAVGGLAGLAYLASRPSGGSSDSIVDQLTDTLASLRQDVESLADDVAGEQGAEDTSTTTADSASGVQSSTGGEFRSTGEHSGGTTFRVSDTDSDDTTDVFVGGLTGDISDEDVEAVESAINVGTIDYDTGLIQGD